MTTECPPFLRKTAATWSTVSGSFTPSTGFFQMDWLRRYAAGEVLGAGPDGAGLAWDRKVRVQRFRSVAREAVAAPGENDRRQIDAYTEGVNAGSRSLRARPWEYLFRDLLPGPLAEFLSPRGSLEWDAPLFGGPIASAPFPGPEVFDLRAEPQALPGSTPWRDLQDFVAGSNNWALGGSWTADGRAWIATDMHLRLRVPNIWYRACVECPEGDGQRRRRAVGVTVRGGPGIVVGSNGRVAWGFTNIQGDWSDLIELDVPAGASVAEEAGL
jgi:penicillin amidase